MRRIAIINQKGGVGKTTTTANLGAALAEQGRRVVLVDMDAQANLSLSLGVEAADGSPTSYSVLVGEATFAAAVRPTAVPNLSLVASHIDLSGAEMELASQIGREFLLRDALEQWASDERARTGRAPADYVLFDCPPSLGLLSINALASAGEVLITLQTEFLALQGMSKLVGVVQLLRKRLNPELVVTGILPCLYESRLRLAREVLGEIRKYFPGQVLPVPIRANVKLAEAPSFGQTIFQYAPDSLGAMDYRCAAREVLRMEARDAELAGLPPFRESVLAGTNYAERATDRAVRPAAEVNAVPASATRELTSSSRATAPAAAARAVEVSAATAPTATASAPTGPASIRPAPTAAAPMTATHVAAAHAATAPTTSTPTTSAKMRAAKRGAKEAGAPPPEPVSAPAPRSVANARAHSAAAPAEVPRSDVTPASKVKPTAHEKRARRAPPVAARAITPPAAQPALAPSVAKGTPARSQPLPAPKLAAPALDAAHTPARTASPTRAKSAKSSAVPPSNASSTALPLATQPLPPEVTSTQPNAEPSPTVTTPKARASKAAQAAAKSAITPRAPATPPAAAPTNAAQKDVTPSNTARSLDAPAHAHPASEKHTPSRALPSAAEKPRAEPPATKPVRRGTSKAKRDDATVLTPLPPPAPRRDAVNTPPAKPLTPPVKPRSAAPARDEERVVRADDLPPLPPDAFEILASFGLDP